MIRLFFLWMDQWMVRLWYLLFPTVVLVILFGGEYGGEIVGLYAVVTALWGTFDLARGVVFNYDFERESV